MLNKKKYKSKHAAVAEAQKKERVNSKSNKKSKMYKRKILINTLIGVCIALIIVGMISIGLIAYIATNFDYNYNKITEDNEELGFEEVIEKNNTNIALFGIDTRNRNSFKGLSDSIMILSVNTKTNKIKLISVMRDSLVPIEKDGKTTYGKINSAYAKGGPELAIKTLNQAFGLDISEYATVNFFGMADIIDAVGGIEAELTSAEVEMGSEARGINGCIVEICRELNLNPKEYYVTTSGTHQLNGIQAVAYSRIRYVSNIWGTANDYGRTDRQRHVMNQLFNKAITMDKGRYISLIKALMPCCETSISYSEALDLAVKVLLNSPTFEQSRVPFTEYTMPAPTTSAGSVVYYDLEYAANIIHAFIYDNIAPEKYIEEYGIRKNNWYAKGYKKPVIQTPMKE